MVRLAHVRTIIYFIILTATVVLFFISFSFTYRRSKDKYYISNDGDTPSRYSINFRWLPERSFKQHEIINILNSTLSKYRLKSKHIHHHDSDQQNITHKEESSILDTESRLQYVAPLNLKHFILNDTVNPVYRSGRCLIRILMYMKRKMMNRIGKHEGTYHCPELNCDYEISYSTTYESLANKHIVILFLRTKWEWADLHAARPPNQIWVMYARESPSYDHCIVPEDQWYNTSYNWTMTYHEDAHFPVPYGRYIPGVPTVPITDNRNWAEGKDRFAAWMASNCKIATYHRQQLIQKLANRFQIDTYGRCGTQSCPKDDFEACNRILSRHKFYFSLENAECNQYITEKLWRNAYMNDIVPIVYGAPKKDYERFAPPNSFIYLGDFSSCRTLTNYLNEINSNDSLYNSFFEWKKKGSIEIINFQTIFSDPSVCKLVAKYLKVRQKDPSDVPDTMPDLNKWWTETCQFNKNIRSLIRN